MTTTHEAVPESVNEVRLLGRVTAQPEQVVLPSGDPLWTFRVTVPRPPDKARPRPGVDALDCKVWGGRVRRSVQTWSVGDVVEVAGALRRRFFLTPQGRVSRVEVEVTSGRLIRRAGSG